MRALMAGWLRGSHVGVCWLSLPRCGFSLSLFCNYPSSQIRLPESEWPLESMMHVRWMSLWDRLLWQSLCTCLNNTTATVTQPCLHRSNRILSHLHCTFCAAARQLVASTQMGVLPVFTPVQRDTGMLTSSRAALAHTGTTWDRCGSCSNRNRP